MRPEQSWQVIWTPRALDDAERLDRRTRQRVLDALDRFAQTGHGDIKRLQGIQPPTWRQRVGDWRALLDLNYPRQRLAVLRVLPRGRAYRAR